MLAPHRDSQEGFRSKSTSVLLQNWVSDMGVLTLQSRQSRHLGKPHMCVNLGARHFRETPKKLPRHLGTRKFLGSEVWPFFFSVVKRNKTNWFDTIKCVFVLFLLFWFTFAFLRSFLYVFNYLSLPSTSTFQICPSRAPLTPLRY